jgi:hypothetical protein
LNWVPIPTRHDSERYSEIMERDDSSEIFSAWILCLQVGARSKPRGSLVRSDGTPHTPSSLSVKTRGRKKWFEKALPFLTQVGWLECVTTDSELTPSRLGDESKLIVIERTEQNRTEQKGKNRTEVMEGFEEFWKAYPRKAAKGEALKVWGKLSPDSELQKVILESLAAQKGLEGWKKEDGKYIPFPDRWLKGTRWLDEVNVKTCISGSWIAAQEKMDREYKEAIERNKSHDNSGS